MHLLSQCWCDWLAGLHQVYPHTPYIALSGQPPTAFPVQSLNLITAGYFLFLLYNATVNGSVLPPQAQKTWAGCLSLRVKGSVLPPLPLGLCFLEEFVFMCERWFVCVWWADAWYFNCGLNRYIMQIYLWCSLPSIYWQKAFMILSSRNQCQIKQLKATWSCVSICLLKKIHSGSSDQFHWFGSRNR